MGHRKVVAPREHGSTHEAHHGVGGAGPLAEHLEHGTRSEEDVRHLPYKEGDRLPYEEAAIGAPLHTLLSTPVCAHLRKEEP